MSSMRQIQKWTCLPQRSMLHWQPLYYYIINTEVLSFFLQLLNHPSLLIFFSIINYIFPSLSQIKQSQECVVAPSVFFQIVA